MLVILFNLLGGIGMFLFGMILLTDGLKAFAGEALRRTLVRFTGNPWKAFGSGALVTLVVQSSSATTITVIGFVSAGLLTFPQAIGVVMGASLGTTGTGWIVSILGLKVNLGFYALPIIGVGAFVRLLGRGRWRSLGFAGAGFGIIFVGIGYLNGAMEGLSEVMDPGSLPADGLIGHLLAMVLGIVMTVVMQSSSAAVATILTALHAEAVSFEQAASLVVGAAVGTTVTGALAAIGGSVSAKRTACAHILFNLATGLIAVVSLPWFLIGIQWSQEHLGLESGAISLAAFHTAFIAVGVIVFLPFTHSLAGLIERLLPDRGTSRYVRHLDNTLLQSPAVALEATRRALSEVAGGMLLAVRVGLDQCPGEVEERRHGELGECLSSIESFFGRIPPLGEDRPLWEARLAQIHAIDHLSRLHAHLYPPAGSRRLLSHARLDPLLRRCRKLLDAAIDGFEARSSGPWWKVVEAEAAILARRRREERPAVLTETARGESGAIEALELLDVIRWLDRVGYHAWRLSNYLAGDATPEETSDPEERSPLR